MHDPDQKRIDATNRDFIRFDQVDKKQDYRLAEAGGGEQFDEDFRIRTCDIGRFLRGDEGDRKAFAQDLGEALREIGFAILTGHGVDPNLYEEAAERTSEVFTRPTLEEKLRYRARRHGSVNQGYFPIKETSDIHPDLVEGWVFCRRAFDMDEDPARPFRAEEFWPMAGAEPFFRRLCREHEKLILPVMQSVLRSLHCDPHLYDRRLTGTNFGLRLNYYPPVGAEDDASGAARLLGHEDVDLFTLVPAPMIEGLQVLNRANMKWIRLTAPAGTIILNTGDYMQRISNDILPSTTHRVSKPRDPALLRQARVSFPFNVYLWEDEILEVLPGLPNPRYPPIGAMAFHTRITSKYYGEGYAADS
ncbi:MAG TPA: 2-oxoglutarate and iron-dependent oxygenase domain-containing protein [Thermoanaerobaculia bacterium]|nr:2-oxoglutarate and iron-dependent oxygenase domain-containing protein [Thermoanaerobaculia bacterium]